MLLSQMISAASLVDNQPSSHIHAHIAAVIEKQNAARKNIIPKTE